MDNGNIEPMTDIYPPHSCGPGCVCGHNPSYVTNEELSQRLEAVEKRLSEILSVVKAIQDEVKPTLDALMSSPMLGGLFKMMGVKKSD